ncbi:DUF3105 domain-containing protein [Lapillicoccus sp.]|uniref:DUF3105 domain-containing protein n=1 Tax=Lapillicoccus sp. TaxID=1909287 RepID=UPI0025E016ED|nr:DUF3105 domain-containing protein [Lapillicoccus sp.]
MATPKQQATSDRQAKVARMRQEQQARERRTRLLIGLVALVVVAGIGVGIGVAVRQGPAPASSSSQVLPTTPTGAATVEQAPTSVPDTSGISGVLAWDTTGWPGDGSAHAGALEHDHVEGPVTYAVVPPVGGPHSATWMNAGVYTAPIPSERAVHNLEHGAVWITYDPNLPAAEVTALTAFVTKQSPISEPAQAVGQSGQSNRYVDLSPWASNTLPTPIVISSWGHQLRLTTADDPRMQKFVDTFRASSTYTPEAGSPVDGVPVSTGGQAATDGGALPNPAS